MKIVLPNAYKTKAPSYIEYKCVNKRIQRQIVFFLLYKVLNQYEFEGSPYFWVCMEVCYIKLNSKCFKYPIIWVPRELWCS